MGLPCGQAWFKSRPEDFRVQEILGFEASGDGEFALVDIEKSQHNTQAVARQLAKRLGINQRRVSYSGMKDRQAVARQTFSIHLPGQPTPDLPAELAPGVRVLGIQRHHRKLRRGSHRANAFEITLRDFRGDRDALAERIEQARLGVPNYFGDQRFGRNGNNLAQAREFYAGEIKLRDRFRSGLLHSTARSWLFNQVLAERVRRKNWDTGAPGEVWMLSESDSVFGPEPESQDLLQRCRDGEIDPTGPLPGDGEFGVGDEVARLEAQVVGSFSVLAAGLARAGMKSSRRRLRLRPREPAYAFEGQHLVLRFKLGRGQFATSVLRELVDLDEGSSLNNS